MNWSSISKFNNIHFDHCKSTEIAFLLCLLGMLELQCVGIFVSFLYAWVSYIPLLISNLLSQNFEGLFSTVSLIFLYLFRDSYRSSFFVDFLSIVYIIYIPRVKYWIKWPYNISFHFCHVDINNVTERTETMIEGFRNSTYTEKMALQCKISNGFKIFYVEILKSMNITMKCILKVMSQQKYMAQQKLTNLVVQIT